MMKKTRMRMLTALWALVLLFSLLVVPASADEDDQKLEERWNIMMVVDGSASLFSAETTDPEGLRFEAIGSFLATLNADSADVGAIIFTSNDTTDTSDEAMQRGILLNTGVLPLTDPATRQNLIDAMKSVKPDYRTRGQTDIGTALRAAQETLSAIDNGRRSAIFLFTDGLTDVDGRNVYEKSMENMQTAIDNIRNEDILLCGVYLNKNGAQKSDEVRNIIMNANNVTDSSLSLGDLYVEITDAQSCMESTDHFLRALGYGLIDDDKDDEIIYGTVDKTFRIPGVGVEEANIRIRSLDGMTLPQGMDVSFTQPDGTVISGADASAICSTGSSYRVYKLEQPMCGTWRVHIEIPEDNKIGVKYNPIFSVNVGALMDTTPGATELHNNMDVNVRGYLTRNGDILTNSDAYREYTCRLYLNNIYTGEIQEIELTQNGSGGFEKTIPLDSYDTYDVVLEFICDKVSVRATPERWILENNPPKVYYAREKVPYGLFQKKTKEVDLSKYAYDLEDGANIQYTLAGGTCDTASVSVQGDKLFLQSASCGSGSVMIDVVDSQGASSQLSITIDNKNMTGIMILIIVGGLLAAAGIALLVIRHINGIVPSGYCTVDFQTTDEDDKFINVSLKPDAPGTGTVGRKTTLYDIIVTELSREHVTGVKPRELNSVKRFIENEAAKELKSISVKCVKGMVDVGNFNGKKISVVQLAVRYDGQVNILYDNVITVRAASTTFDFGYFDNRDQD